VKITLIDYGVGNLPSVERAVIRLGAETERAATAENLDDATALILPGVGHYGALIRALEKNGLREALIAAVGRGVPFLGICLGLQALYQMSEEAPELAGLKILPGSVRVMTGATKLPHMGWNQLNIKSASRLLEGVDPGGYFYFAHSYAATYADGVNSSATRATCTYGVEFVAVAEKDNIFAVQFHPEKSGAAGERVLSNFLSMAA
jgi:imidazole glycerol phosphate synthase glutamine amidotransferase subunit